MHNCFSSVFASDIRTHLTYCPRLGCLLFAVANRIVLAVGNRIVCSRSPTALCSRTSSAFLNTTRSPHLWLPHGMPDHTSPALLSRCVCLHVPGRPKLGVVSRLAHIWPATCRTLRTRSSKCVGTSLGSKPITITVVKKIELFTACRRGLKSNHHGIIKENGDGESSHQICIGL